MFKYFAGWRCYRYAFGGALVLTTLASLLPGETIGPLVGHYDKLWHAAAWLLISLFATYAFALKSRARWIVLLLIAWSFVIEIAQQYVPLRAFEWADLFANSVGVLLGVVIARLLRHLPLISVK